MRLKVNNVRVSLLEETSVKEAAAKKLGLKKQDIDNLQIVRRGGCCPPEKKIGISSSFIYICFISISIAQKWIIFP